MSLLQRLTPTNLLEEKEKFFTDNSYNPQFVYEEEISEQDLYKYGLPKEELVKKAQSIVTNAFANGKTESDLVAEDGPIISQEKVTDMVSAFLKAHDLQDRISISWSSSYVSRATMSTDTLKLRSTAQFRHYDTIGMIYHEIGTHALRRINYEQQPWYKKKKKYGIVHSYLPTEEGLASIHSLLPKKNKSAYSTALRYLAVDFAQNHGFVELWNFLTPYVDEIEKRWMICVRQKRGMTDTSYGGGFTKDLVYFEGTLNIISWLSRNNYNCKNLYIGKISTHDLELAIPLSKIDSIIYPKFFNENYLEQIVNIANTNNIK